MPLYPSMTGAVTAQSVNMTTGGSLPLNGIWQRAASNLGFSANNSDVLGLNSTQFYVVNGAGAAISTGTGGAAVASVIPNRGSTGYGLGGNGSSNVTLVANNATALAATSTLISIGAAPGAAVPALKRSTATLQARLGDDSGFTNFQGKLTTDTNYTAGAPTPTGYLTLYDATGTAYKVPAQFT